jgi:hypothetical protein
VSLDAFDFLAGVLHIVAFSIFGKFFGRHTAPLAPERPNNFMLR